MANKVEPRTVMAWRWEAYRGGPDSFVSEISPLDRGEARTVYGPMPESMIDAFVDERQAIVLLFLGTRLGLERD